jgi:hypothetical protein
MLTLLSDGLSPISEDGYPHSLVEVGAMIALCHQNDEHGSYGVTLDFVEWFDEFASVVDRAHAVAGRPELLDAGHAKWNVYLASLGEHMAISNGFVVPEWTAELPRRRLSKLWCPMDIPTDIRDCPPTFWSRNILVANEDFRGFVIPSPYADPMLRDMSDEEVEGYRRSLAMLAPNEFVVKREVGMDALAEILRLRECERKLRSELAAATSV